MESLAPASSPHREGSPRLVIVCGHPRSGTTLLTRLFNTHPDITLTHELRTFVGMGKPLHQHLQLLRNHNLWRLPPLRLRGVRRRWPSKVASVVFLLRYALGLALRGRQRVDLDDMRHVLGGILPRASVIGDKYPQYVFELDRYAAEPGLLIVAIYRDARDVVRSAIEKSKRGGRRAPDEGEGLRTPESAARSWVKAIERMERNRERLHVICYEQLVREPEPTLRDLAGYLGVDPTGFRLGLIKQDRVGKHKLGLSEADQAIVVDIAGDAMRRLGYL